MEKDDRTAEAAGTDPETLALEQTARRRAQRRREADRNEIFTDVYKSVEEIRSEWQDAAKKVWFWTIGLAITVLGGLVWPVSWVLSLIVGTGLLMAWGSARERKSAYRRALFESDLERQILAHEGKDPVDAAP